MKTMRVFVVFLVLLAGMVCVTTVQTQAETPDLFQQVRILVPDRATLNRIWSAGVDYEGVTGKIGGLMEFVIGPEERTELDRAGIIYEVVIPDLASFYEERLSLPLERPEGFGYGSMGGFYTYAEVVQQLDSMRLLFPNLISPKQSIGSTVELRTIWAVKISDNPEVVEPSEPEVLYTALHHAREPQGMMTILYYMWWLLENYDAHPEATYLVNNRQMWFIPVVNPDGFVYNQTTNPSGGGMWRKNRRSNPGGSFGVDLNRNYGPYYMWNASNGGSSTSPTSDTYRGTAEFSEPETQTIDAFLRARNIKTCFNYHTYGNYVIYPFGYLSRENSDSLTYRDWTYDMTTVGRYTNGTDQQTVNYSTRGNSDDYMFGDTTKPVTYTMTPEVGISGFWPSSSQIFPLAIENLHSNKHLAYFAGHFPKLKSFSIREADSTGSLIAGENFSVGVLLRNIGLGDATNLTVTVSADVSWIEFPAGPAVITSFPSRTDSWVEIQGLVSATAPGTSRFNFFVTCTDNDGFSKRDTVTAYIGKLVTLFSDNATNGTTNWLTGQGWGTTSLAYSPPLAFTDSPSGSYAVNANNALTMSTGVGLTGVQFAQLRFWARWAIEPTWDFATVELSTNNGSSWVMLRAPLSRPGSGRSGSKQPAGSYGFDSYTPGLTWVEQAIDLTPFVGQIIKLRFVMQADNGDQRDGIYLDDIRILGFTVPPPPTPQLLNPPNGSIAQPLTPVLEWNQSPGATSYWVQVADDSLFTVLIASDSTMADTTFQPGGLQYSNDYYWRVRPKSIDGIGTFSLPYSFSTLEAVTRPVQIQPFWNLVSIPVTVADPRRGSIFPTATSAGYRFQSNSGYRISDSLFNTVGYWLKFGAAQVVNITGLERDRDTIHVTTGWNLIGTTSDSIHTSAVIQIPEGTVETPFYGYDGSYTPASTLEPGKSYWVKARNDGMIVLVSPATRMNAVAAPKNTSLPARRIDE